MKPGLKQWRLKSKEERRFKQGHPWVYSNELQESPKGIQAGEMIELSDAGGAFLAYGFGNPSSLIAFRTLSREKLEDSSSVIQKILLVNLKRAFEFRKQWFGLGQSFRLVYGEADDLPGLVIDRYFGTVEGSKPHAVYVVQPHSAGMDLNLPVITEALAKLSAEMGDSSEAKVVYRRDAGSREREGLAKEPTVMKVLSTGAEVKESDPYRLFTFQLQSLMAREVSLTTDLISGQKTGFFFDQAQNVKEVQHLLLRKLRYESASASGTRKPHEVLDLCSYIGQWSVQLAQVFQEKGLPVKITAVDASESALKLAEMNVRRNALISSAIGKAAPLNKSDVSFAKVKADVLEPMPLGENYDVVIADPPAFIKNRKAIPQGKHAYVQLFTTAIQKTARSGLVVCCSCSQLLSSEDMREVLAKATRRSGRKVRWIAQGSPSLDHFMRLDFEEGLYLKSWIGHVE